MIVRYFIAGRCVLEELVNAEAAVPRCGDERGLDGKVYRAERVVRHLPDCPPDVIHVHLCLAMPEAIYPLNYPG